MYVNPNLPIHPTPPSPVGVHTFVLYIYVSVSALQTGWSVQSEVKSEREKQISYINAYMWNLEKWYSGWLFILLLHLSCTNDFIPLFVCMMHFTANHWKKSGAVTQ